MGLPTVARGKQDGTEAWLRVDGEIGLHKDLDTVGSSARIIWGIESPLPKILDHLLTGEERVWLDWFIVTWRGKAIDPG